MTIRFITYVLLLVFVPVLRTQDTEEELLEFATGTEEDLPAYLSETRTQPDTLPASAPLEIDQRFRLFRKYPDSRGFSSGIYPGSPWKWVERFRFTAGPRLEGGLLFEKDPGEPQWNDHQTGYLSWNAGSHFRMVTGHYMIQTGQGLTAWGPYAQMSGTAPLTGSSGRMQPVRGYLYTDETQAMQGLAALFHLKIWQILIYVSDSKRDANSDSLITGFPESGLHRTESERIKKRTVHERSAGGRVGVSLPSAAIGFSVRHDRYSLPVVEDDLIRQRYAFQGISNQVMGLDWHLDTGGCRFSGEAARSDRGLAWMSRLSYRKGNWKGSVLTRFGSADFVNRHAKGFGSADAANAAGAYLGGQIRIPVLGTLIIVQDISRTLWRTWQLPMPQEKSDTFLQLKTRTINNCELHLQWRRQSRQISGEAAASGGRILAAMVQETKNRFRLELLFKPAVCWSVKCRIENLILSTSGLTGELNRPALQENGSLILQDIRFQNRSRTWDLRFRWISYRTDSFDSRIYTYENDLPGRMNNTFFYGQGNRRTLLLTWKPFSSMTFSVKYGVTYHDGAVSWGSGYDTISGDTVRDLGLQMDIRH